MEDYQGVVGTASSNRSVQREREKFLARPNIQVRKGSFMSILQMVVFRGEREVPGTAKYTGEEKIFLVDFANGSVQREREKFLARPNIQVRKGYFLSIL